MKQLVIRTRAPHTLSIAIFEVQVEAWTLWAWRSQLTLQFKLISLNDVSEVLSEGEAWPISHYIPIFSSNQFLRLPLSQGTFRAPGLTKYVCSLKAFIMLSYLIVPFPLLLTKIENSVRLGDVPLALQQKASWRHSLGQVDMRCWGVRSQFYLSALKISINWKCSCWLKSQCSFR